MESLKSKKVKGNTETLKWIFRFTKKYIPLVVIIAILSAAVSLSYVYLALLSKKVLDIATGNASGNMLYTTIGIIAVVILQIVVMGVEFSLKQATTGKLTVFLRNKLFSSISRKKYSQISNCHSGDLLNRLTSDCSVVISGVVGLIPSIASMAAKIIGGISALLMLDYRIALLILCCGFFVPALGRIINRKFKYLHKKVQESEGKSRSFMQESFENLAVVKTFSGEQSFYQKLNKYLLENYRFTMKRKTISMITSLGLYAFFTVGYYGVLLWGADGIKGGIITYGTLMAFLQLVQQLRAPLQNVSGIVPQYYSAIASAERLIEIEAICEDRPAVSKEEITKLRDGFKTLEINNITFAYKQENILNNLSFSIERGKITAITGESGSGKSTIFKLILGLFEAQKGNITYNCDTVIDTSMRGLFAYVPQGNMILSGTIRENLTLCNEEIDEESIIEAVKAAEIYEFIKTLPKGLDTELSERGAGLSEGQLQRISIARALLTEAPVLLLDEATSALDEPTETKVLDNIKSISDKAVLFVTHRNTSLKVCDRIIHIG